MTTKKKKSFPSQPVPNPKGVYKVGSSLRKHQEEAKSIMSLRERNYFFLKKVEVPTQETFETSSSYINPSNDSSLNNLEEISN